MPIGPTVPNPNPSLWLQAEFLRRRERNPRFSLRAFGRMLNIPPGRLSEVFSRKRPLTIAMGQRIAERLAYSPAMRIGLLQAIQRQQLLRSGGLSPHPGADGTEQGDDSDRQLLREDEFRLIADWQHFALLYLFETRGFRSDPAWMARRIGIPPHEAQAALERLERLGLIARRQKRYVKLAGELTTTQDISSAALRQSHRQSLEQAIRALEEVPLELRDVTSITMAIDPRRIPAAKLMIRDFRRRLCRFLEQGRRTEVFNLNVQLVPVTVPVAPSAHFSKKRGKK
ncbi:MAG: DUF4423 domain-containing protein [Oligoflexia bacterium]|nr:DUF4423 domain-containing protein [Oligoflexia bacterium]